MKIFKALSAQLYDANESGRLTEFYYVIFSCTEIS